MKVMSEIYSRIQEDYRKLREINEINKENAKQDLYLKIPRIENIDREISLLAIKSAERVLKENITPQQAAEDMNRQAEILRAEKKLLLESNNYTEYVPTYTCSKCSDTGYIEEGKRCSCFVHKLQSYLKFPCDRNSSDVEFLKNSVFENFNLEYYSKKNDSAIGRSPYDVAKANLAHCIKFANDFKAGESGNLFLFGPSGLGKTFTAGCIANKISENGNFVIYKSAYKLFEFLEDYKFSRIDRETYSMVYNAIYDCDLLIIDDFGTEFITSYTQSVFFDLLNSRLCENKSMIISTNLPFGKIADVYQERVMSRLQNEFKVLRFIGDDIRALKNK